MQERNSKESYPSYSVAIRTLGKAGEKYQKTLDSVDSQSVQPENIFVCLPYGYQLPKETINREKFIFCEKGMVAQRSLPFDEIYSEYILFLDDDVSFDSNFVKTLLEEITLFGGDCIAPDTFACNKDSFIIKLRNFLSGTRIHHKKDWAFIIRKDAGFSYNNHPTSNVLLTETASGPCCLCRKSAYLSINFQEERWIDRCRYAMGEDQLFYYKLFLSGHKVLISYDAKILHLDAASGHEQNKYEMWYSVSFCKYVIWYRTIFECTRSYYSVILFYLINIINFILSFPLTFARIVKNRSFKVFTIPFAAINDARKFVYSEEYQRISPFI